MTIFVERKYVLAGMSTDTQAKLQKKKVASDSNFTQVLIDVE